MTRNAQWFNRSSQQIRLLSHLLEPLARKLARAVLRGGCDGNIVLLPDKLYRLSDRTSGLFTRVQGQVLQGISIPANSLLSWKPLKRMAPNIKEVNKIEKQDLLILNDSGIKLLNNVNRHAFMRSSRIGMANERLSSYLSCLLIYGTRWAVNKPLPMLS